MFWLLLAAAQATPPVPAFYPWGRFSRAPALTGVAETVEIATDGRDGDGLQYKLRLVRQDRRGNTETLWTNGRTCRAVRPMLASLPALPMPRVAPPGFESGRLEVVVDGVGYGLHMPAALGRGYGSVDMASNVDTPLAAWVDGALATLAPCWSTVELRIR